MLLANTGEEGLRNNGQLSLRAERGNPTFVCYCEARSAVAISLPCLLCLLSTVTLSFPLSLRAKRGNLGGEGGEIRDIVQKAILFPSLWVYNRGGNQP